MIIDQHDYQALEKLHRVQLATSLPGAKPIQLVGTKSADGITNLAPFSSVVHLGSSPLLIGMVTRPDTVERHTLRNIQETASYTLNHITPAFLSQAHQCSARYDISEFDATGLTPHFHEEIHAPFVAESPIRYALRLRDQLDIEANGTKLIIGEVTHIEFSDDLALPDGGLDLIKAQSLASTALDTYFQLVPHAQLPYAKP